MKVIISGNLTKDVNIVYFESGKCKASFSVATNSYDFKKKEQKPNYFNIDAWQKTAEFIAEKYKKGSPINLLCEYKEDKYTKEGTEKVRKYFNVLKVYYTDAITNISGKVIRLENRYTQNNKRIQYIKLDTSDITLVNKTQVEVLEDDVCDVIGELIQKEKDYILEVISITVPPRETEDDDIVTFSDGTQEEIPF